MVEAIEHIYLVTRNSQGIDKSRFTLFEVLNNDNIAYALIVTNPINDEDKDRGYRRLGIIHKSKLKRLQLLGFDDKIYHTLDTTKQQRILREEEASLQNTDIFMEEDKVVSRDNHFYYDDTHQELINSLLLVFSSE